MTKQSKIKAVLLTIGIVFAMFLSVLLPNITHTDQALAESNHAQLQINLTFDDGITPPQRLQRRP